MAITRVRTSPPQRLVDGGEFAFGTYDSPVPEVNLLDRWSGPARAFHNSRLKEWQAFQLGTDDWFVLGAVYDAKLLGLVQIVAVHTPTGTAHRWEHKVPSAALRIASGLDGTRSRGSALGLSVAVNNDVRAGRIRVTAEQGTRRNRPSLTLDATGHCRPGEVGHLVICHPFPDGTPLYSNKCVMPATGVLRFGDTAVEFTHDRAFMILDDHKGHYPSPMVYDWVTGAGRDDTGRLVGFNLTDNQVRDPETFNENALFVNGDVHRLGAVHVERPHGVHRPWRVTDREGGVDVTFEPTVPNEQHVGPRSFLADYYGPFGWCSGTIETPDGIRVSVDGMFGMGEQKFIRF